MLSPHFFFVSSPCLMSLTVATCIVLVGSDIGLCCWFRLTTKMLRRDLHSPGSLSVFFELSPGNRLIGAFYTICVDLIL